MSSAEDLVLLEPAEMAVADRLTIDAGVSGTTLMDNAGYAVADDICVRHGHGTRVAVVCGPGNNGGDGFVAARVLAERGFVVRLGLLGDRAGLSADAAFAAQRYRGPVEPASPALLDRADVIVDALFGAGLSRPLVGEAAAMVEAINAAGRRGAIVVAVDLPSGIDGRTGAVQGVAVEARRSVTFFRMKPGHLLLPGRLHAGRVVVADIGIRPGVLRSIGARCHANEPGLWAHLWPRPSIDAHKYSRGAVVVASGPAHACGAARLAAASALQAGAGLVAVACPPDAVPVVAAYRAALVVKPVDGAAAFAAIAGEPRVRAVVAGPGIGTDEEAARIVAAAVATSAALVLDADALTIAARDGALRAAIRARTSATVVTPHEGEYARLFPGASGSKLERARMAAADLGAIVVLKGPDTVIAAPDGRAAINANAPPALATAGSGDVLAGIVAAMLAQSVPAFEGVAMAVHLHGRAGSEAGPGLVADDLVPALGRVVGEGPSPP
jgi:hydroxyethylthiazole kinase-like uncharacterized protein yjeF